MHTLLNHLAAYANSSARYLKSLTNKQVLLLIITIGLMSHVSGLFGQFQGDDQYQIVDNVAIRSLGNVGNFFTAGTFYNGEQLTGTFYRPLMTTIFSVIYTVFGPAPFAFHIFQLVLHIGSAYLIFMILRLWIKKEYSILAALVFLVHPITSQVVYSIPCMQDALYMFFGLLALWLLQKDQSSKTVAWTLVCLLLALLSKETAIIFVAVMAAYVMLFKHSYRKIIMVALFAMAVIYIAVRINAVGWPHAGVGMAPIAQAPLGVRLLTAPSIMAFFIAKLMFPVTLSTSYYWVVESPTLRDFVAPLVVSLLFFMAIFYAGKKIYLRRRTAFKGYIVFVVLFMLGLSLTLQIIPLDMTACETWGYPLLLGSIGGAALFITSTKLSSRKRALVQIASQVVIVLLAILSLVRGFDYSTQLSLYSHDISVNETNFLAHNNVAQSLAAQQRYTEAKTHALRSIELFPLASSYSNLGSVEQRMGNYLAAEHAFTQALQYDSFGVIYENLALAKLAAHKGGDNVAFFKSALKKYPHSAKLWLYLALEQADMGDVEAKQSIDQTAQYTTIPPQLYVAIHNSVPLSFTVPGTTRVIVIK